MNISELINQKTKDLHFEKDYMDAEIIINLHELEPFGESIVKTFETESNYPYIEQRLSRSLTVDGVQFRQDGRIVTDDKEFIVWALLEDKIILKLISYSL